MFQIILLLVSFLNVQFLNSWITHRIIVILKHKHCRDSKLNGMKWPDVLDQNRRFSVQVRSRFGLVLINLDRDNRFAD